MNNICAPMIKINLSKTQKKRITHCECLIALLISNLKMELSINNLIKKRMLIVIVVFLFIISFSLSQSNTYSAYHIYEGIPDSVWNIPLLHVGYKYARENDQSANNEFITLIKFNQQYRILTEAKLTINLYEYLNDIDLDVDVVAITNWPSAAVSYNNPPGYGDVLTSFTITPAQQMYTITIHLTKDVKGIALRGREGLGNEKIITIEDLEIEGEIADNECEEQDGICRCDCLATEFGGYGRLGCPLAGCGLFWASSYECCKERALARPARIPEQSFTTTSTTTPTTTTIPTRPLPENYVLITSEEKPTKIIFENGNKSCKSAGKVCSGVKVSCHNIIGNEPQWGNSSKDCSHSSSRYPSDCVYAAVCEWENKKDISRYSDREVFLISDKDWHNVLPLVPVTTWTGTEENCQRGYGTPDNVCVYPTLIYHEEANSFDADSIIYFMQQFNTEKVTISGETPQELDNLLVTSYPLGPSIGEENMKRISVSDYLSYWKSFNDIVYVEDDYTAALMASTYASLINAPLIIQGTGLDVSEVFEGRNVICVGSVNFNCDERYNLEQLQRKYFEETETKKFILVNPSDLNSATLNDELQPERSAEKIKQLYTKTSLSAPILASAKHELIITTNENGYTAIDNDLKSKIHEFYDFSEQFLGYSCSFNNSCVSGYFYSGFYFNIGNINTQDYKEFNLFIDLSRDFDGSIYLNNLLIGNLDKVCNNFWCPNLFVIPINLIQEESQIKMIPKQGSIRMNDQYRANVRLVPRFSSGYYLTIIASPQSVPISDDKWYLYPGTPIKINLDASEYTDFNEDNLPDFGVGRIIGLTLSDASSYIARDLFHNVLEKTNNMEFMASLIQNRASPTQTSDADIIMAQDLNTKFLNAGYSTSLDLQYNDGFYGNPSMWENKELISYNDHGNVAWAGISSNELPWLSNSFISANACSTCSIFSISSFCMNSIRKGAIGYIGAVSTAFLEGFNVHKDVIYGLYQHDKTLGDAFASAFRYDSGMYMIALIGDPTFHPNPPYLLNEGGSN